MTPLFRTFSAAIILLSATIFLGSALPTSALAMDGCGTTDCKKCHTLTVGEATKILDKFKPAGIDNILRVSEAPVRGMWVVDVQRGKDSLPVYIDFGKKHVISGAVIAIDNLEDLTMTRVRQLNAGQAQALPQEEPPKSKVLTAAELAELVSPGDIMMGNPKASKTIAVFTDPDCPYCQKLHAEMRKVVVSNPDIRFRFKLVSVHGERTAQKVRDILCSKDPKSIDDAFEGKEIPKRAAECDGKGFDEATALAKKFGLGSTPTLVFPDGQVWVGSLAAEDIVQKATGQGAKAESSVKAAEPKK